MPVEHIEVFVEEPSMERALSVLLPRIIGNTSVAFHSYQGKPALLKELPARLRGYRDWLPKNWLILIVVDRDDDNCQDLKQRIENAARSAGLVVRSQQTKGQFQVLTRIVIEELEAWYFGDWAAVRLAYPRAPLSVPKYPSGLNRLP
jgi:hypothetical protein